MKATRLIYFSIVALVALGVWSLTAHAFPTYSQGKVTNFAGEEEAFGNCKACHGHFRATNEDNPTLYLRDEYISLTDGKGWSVIYQEVEADEPEEEIGLHDIHRHVMLDEVGVNRCRVCHLTFFPSSPYPVILNSSSTPDLDPIGCTGCHGRNEDDSGENPSSLGGRGAGLRQHHTNASVTECKTCHADADPANYTSVGEDVLPAYYRVPNDVFVNKPTDPCNQHGEEDYAGIREGLDNDGDGKYDMSDSDCRPGGR